MSHALHVRSWLERVRCQCRRRPHLQLSRRILCWSAKHNYLLVPVHIIIFNKKKFTILHVIDLCSPTCSNFCSGAVEKYWRLVFGSTTESTDARMEPKEHDMGRRSSSWYWYVQGKKNCLWLWWHSRNDGLCTGVWGYREKSDLPELRFLGNIATNVPNNCRYSFDPNGLNPDSFGNRKDVYSIFSFGMLRINASETSAVNPNEYP